MAVTITGNNTPTAGGVTYGDGSTYATTTAGTSGQPIVSGGSGAPTFRPYTLPASDGSANQVLQTNGSGALSFATPSTGAMTLVSTATASSSSYIVFTGLDYSTYKQYMVLVSSAVPNNSGYTLYMQMSNDNGSTWKTGSTAYYYYSLFLGIASYSNQGANDAGIAFQSQAGTSNDATIGGTNLNVYLNSLTNSSRNNVYFQGFNQDPSYGGAPFFGGGELLSTAGPINGIRFYFNGGRLITSGTFKLYGIT